jgi:hypothetical protein
VRGCHPDQELQPRYTPGRPVEVLLDRIPDVELAVPANMLRWKQAATMRGLEALPVTFTPTAAR